MTAKSPSPSTAFQTRTNSSLVNTRSLGAATSGM